MLVQTRKCLSDKPIVRKFPKKTSNSAFNFLCGCIYGINHKKANQIVNTYQLESLSDLMKLNKEDLMNVDGIGEKNAERILEAIQ
jgi:ERCC4-type nuclease